MPGASSLAMLPRLRIESPDTRVVIFTMQADAAFARQALGAGATAYVLKEAADTQIVDAIRSVVTGGPISTLLSAPPSPPRRRRRKAAGATSARASTRCCG